MENMGNNVVGAIAIGFVCILTTVSAIICNWVNTREFDMVGGVMKWFSIIGFIVAIACYYLAPS